MWQLVLASRHRFIHQEEQEEDAERVPDGHGRSLGSWPWQKQTDNYSQSSCQPKKNLILLNNPHVFSGLCKTIRSDQTLPNLLK